MPQFYINANDAIIARHPYVDLDTFAKGYVEAMFFTNCDSGDEDEDRANDLGVDALTDESVDHIAKYCASFQRDAAPLLERAYDRDYDEEQAGRDLWFTAQGHGVGYWDRKELEADGLGDELSQAAKRAGEVYCTIGDDDRIHV